ncbi:hypothetical protein Q7P36_002021 [Cladosporium allicinum]
MPDPSGWLAGWLEKLLGSDKPFTAEDGGFAGFLKARKQAQWLSSVAHKIRTAFPGSELMISVVVQRGVEDSRGLDNDNETHLHKSRPRILPTSSRIVDGWRWHDSGLHAPRS